MKFASNPPPKDKPVAMVFCGSFSPMHMGHVKAARTAMRLLRKSGYNVRKLIMCPSPNKILIKKLGKDAYPIEDRVPLIKLSVQAVRDIEVSGDAAREAKKFKGKLRRTQIADWAQRHHPAATIVKVTGENQATGHGHEPPGFPSLYAGTPGSEHAGYCYLALARSEGGISSIKIRALSAENKPIPPHSMHPDATRRFPVVLANRKKLHLERGHHQARHRKPDGRGEFIHRAGNRGLVWG